MATWVASVVSKRTASALLESSEEEALFSSAMARSSLGDRRCIDVVGRTRVQIGSGLVGLVVTKRERHERGRTDAKLGLFNISYVSSVMMLLAGWPTLVAVRLGRIQREPHGGFGLTVAKIASQRADKSRAWV